VRVAGAGRPRAEKNYRCITHSTYGFISE
jgi:hypothetical protein